METLVEVLVLVWVASAFIVFIFVWGTLYLTDKKKAGLLFLLFSILFVGLVLALSFAAVSVWDNGQSSALHAVVLSVLYCLFIYCFHRLIGDKSKLLNSFSGVEIILLSYGYGIIGWIVMAGLLPLAVKSVFAELQ